MIYRIKGTSILSACRPDLDPRPAIEQAAGLGFNLMRVFCGVLPWANQTLDDVYRNLPGVLSFARDHGLHVYLSYNTDAGVGYDLDAHTNNVNGLTLGLDNVLREVGNEPWDQEQGGRLPPARCQQLSGLMVGGPVGYGAAQDDESLDYAGGDFAPVHLDRGRDKWNMVRRVREVMGVSERTGKPAFNQEPIGAAEQPDPGRRENDPDIFYTMGALNSLMGVGGVFHSDDGLQARPLAGRQLECARAYLRGASIIPETPSRLVYKNVGHDGSPVRSATFNEGDLTKPGCTRAYSGLHGSEGWTVELGCSGPSLLQWDWHDRHTLDDRQTVRIYHVRP